MNGRNKSEGHRSFKYAYNKKKRNEKHNRKDDNKGYRKSHAKCENMKKMQRPSKCSLTCTEVITTNRRRNFAV